MPIGSVASLPPLIAGNVDFTANLSPDALMVYVRTRLNGLDDQVDTIFNDQKRQQAVQGILREINSKLATLDNKNGGAFKLDDPGTHTVTENRDPKSGTTVTKEIPNLPTTRTLEAEVANEIKALADIDPKLAQQIHDTLHQPGQVFGGDRLETYTGAEVSASQTYLDGIGKDLESQASLNMIRLQSIMSTRQTAVQLATNMISALGETTKAVVANVGH